MADGAGGVLGIGDTPSLKLCLVSSILLGYTLILAFIFVCPICIHRRL
jgi:hypothetical protein